MENIRIHLREVPAAVDAEGREFAAAHDYYLETRPNLPDRIFLLCQLKDGSVFGQTPIQLEDIDKIVEFAESVKKTQAVEEELEAELKKAISSGGWSAPELVHSLRKAVQLWSK